MKNLKKLREAAQIKDGEVNACRHGLAIYNDKDRFEKLFDVRGWGFLTGTGTHCRKLDDDTAIEIQTARANYLAALINEPPDQDKTVEGLRSAIELFISRIEDIRRWNGKERRKVVDGLCGELKYDMEKVLTKLGIDTK